MDMTIGEKIKELRKDRKMTQQELAKKSGITCASIINIERGYNKPSAGSLYKISEALNYSFDALMDLL